MQPAAAPTDRNTDIASTVVATMRQLGVLGLPRNYEIFYEALSGGNHELSLAVVSLSNRPTQEDLDRIGRTFFAQHHGPGIVEHARETSSPRNSRTSPRCCAANAPISKNTAGSSTRHRAD